MKEMITPCEEQKEKESLLDNLTIAGILSAKNGGNGMSIHLTDFQINYLRDLVKGDLESERIQAKRHSAMFF